MTEQELQKDKRPIELIRAEKLIDEGRYDEALELMKPFEENEEQSLQDIVSCHLLKCNLLFQQGKYENVIKLADQTYNESLELGNKLFSVDALLIMAFTLTFTFKMDVS